MPYRQGFVISLIHFADRLDGLEHVVAYFEAAECEFVQIGKSQTSWYETCESAELTVEVECYEVSGIGRTSLFFEERSSRLC